MPQIDPRFAEVKELAAVCKSGDLSRMVELLQEHPQILDSPDYDTRFPYPESCLWSPLFIATMYGREPLVDWLLENGANPVPFEVGGQYHHHTYSNWTKEPLARGYDSIVRKIEDAIQRKYGPFPDDANILQAVLSGNIESVRSLIAEKPERVRQVDAVGNTALHVAVARNNAAMARMLIESGSPIDALNGGGRTPLVVAMFGFHRWWRDEWKGEIFDLLLKSGAKYTMLAAATIGDLVQVRKLLHHDPSLANAADPCWRRPLSGAVSHGQTDVVKALLDHGAEPNAKEGICQGGLSLRAAAGHGFREIVRLLLEHGAVPEHWVDSSGDALFAAQNHKEILHLLYAYGGTMELQVYAASHRIDVIAEVLKLAPSKAKNVLPYGWDDNGSEDLAYNIMRLAIFYGARFEDASEWNMRWTITKYPRVFRLLQQHGANPDLPLRGIAGDIRRRYESPVQQLGCIRFLVEECGADVNCRSEEGMTPLADAAAQGHLDIVEYLLSKGANANPSVPEWAKPMALAERAGHKEVAAYLRRHGF
jgi:ankyrin repeat protein